MWGDDGRRVDIPMPSRVKDYATLLEIYKTDVGVQLAAGRANAVYNAIVAKMLVGSSVEKGYADFLNEMDG